MKQQGLTLIELTTAIAIITLTSTIGVGQFNSLLKNSQARNGFLALLQQTNATRQYAISNLQPAIFCPSYNKKDCVNDWKAQKMIFLDSNDNQKRDSNESIKGLFSAVLDKNIRIKYPKTQIRFDERGITNFYNGTLAYCMKDIIKGLVISKLGRIRIAQDLNGDKIPDINANKPVSCN